MWPLVLTGPEDEVVVLQRRLGDAEANNGQLNEELEKVGSRFIADAFERQRSQVTEELMVAMQRLHEERQRGCVLCLLPLFALTDCR